MQDRSAISAIFLSATLCLATVAHAQTEDDPAGTESPEAGANQDDGSTSIAPPPDTGSPNELRRAHLDQLFAQLANPDNPDWERVQAQIWAAWNRSGSPSMDLLAQRADKAMEAEDYGTAMMHLNDLTRLAPDFAEGWNKRATLHFIQGKYGPSLEDIARTLKLEDRHFGALSGLGIILDRVGDKEGALEAYRRAIEIHPNLPGAEEGIRKLTREVEGERL